MTDDSPEVARPRIEVRGGNPSDDELAAVLTVLQAASAAPEAVDSQDDRPLAGGWKSYARIMRRCPMPGRAAWVYSSRP